MADQLVEKHITGHRFSDFSDKLHMEIPLKEMTSVRCAVKHFLCSQRQLPEDFWLTPSDTESVREQNIRSERWNLASMYWIESFGQDIMFSPRTSMHDLARQYVTRQKMASA